MAYICDVDNLSNHTFVHIQGLKAFKNGNLCSLFNYLKMKKTLKTVQLQKQIMLQI